MTDITDEALVRRHQDLRAYLDSEDEKHAASLAPWKEMFEVIEGEMLRRLNERDATNSKTPAGTFFKKKGTSTRVVDKVKFFDHIFEQRMQGMPNCYDMLTQAVAKDSVLAFMKENDGKTPPGVEATDYIKIQIRKG